MKLRIRPDELKKRRLLAPMSQEELAAKAEISPSAVSKLEVLGGNVNPSTARGLASALGCELTDIVEIVETEEATA